ncbi:MAG TPA: efflux transporter outer membrane subunit [Mariprofundaceae bacterium]|nr:efflux transporter outer membrane subunit [Mariprofundaceae bacterium]
MESSLYPTDHSVSAGRATISPGSIIRAAIDFRKAKEYCIVTAAYRSKTLAVALPMLLLVSGCAVGPDFKSPDAPAVKGYTRGKVPAQTAMAETDGGAAQRFIEGQDIPAKWWELFHSPALNSLVKRAIRSNPSLQVAQAALQEAQENVYAGEGAFFPNIDANGSAKHQKISSSQFGRPNGGSYKYSLYNASVSISYVLDVFGGERRQLESLEAQRNYQQFQLEAAYLTLTANVVTTAVKEASLRAQVAASREIIKAESEQLDVLKQQFALGAASKNNVLAQQARLAQTKATLPPLEKQLSLVRHQLKALAGDFPSEDHGETFDFSSMQLPQTLPVSLPSKLVEQRPDIRSAEAQLHQASAQIGVATANMFPKLTLNGDYGTVSTKAGNLFSANTGIWSVGANLLQPLIHGGTLLHQRRAAVQAYKKAAAQYRGTVLTAFQNVADALRALQSDADALKAQTESLNSASDSLELSRQQYKVGAISYITLLDAQRTYEQARISRVQSQADRYADTAALFQALGGGWWNRDDVANVSQADEKAAGQ